MYSEKPYFSSKLYYLRDASLVNTKKRLLFSSFIFLNLMMLCLNAYPDFQKGPYYCYENENQPPNCVIPITNPYHPSNNLFLNNETPREGDFNWGYFPYQDFNTQDSNTYPNGGFSGYSGAE